MGRDIIARGMASGAIKVNINAGHIFVDNTARDAYFVTNPTELVENMYVYCNSKLQQYDGSIWVDRSAAIQGSKGDKGDNGITPHIDLTTNNWFIDTIDTGIKAIGVDGVNGINGINGADGVGVQTVIDNGDNTFTVTLTNGAFTIIDKIDTINSDVITQGTTNLFFTTTEKNKLTSIEENAEVNNISDTNATDLTDSGDTTLHYHASDRDRTNHTGAQAISTITGLQTSLDSKTNKDFTTYTQKSTVSSDDKIAINDSKDTNSVKYVTLNQLVSSVQDPHNKGYFETGTALNTAIPTANDGDFAVVGATNTVWVWSTASSDFVDSGANGAVASVNGRTGIVTLTKADVGLNNVVNLDTSTTANITDSTDKRFVTDANLVVIGNTSNTNTGDETQSSILTKIGYTPENVSNKDTDVTLGSNSDIKYPTQKAVKTYADTKLTKVLADGYYEPKDSAIQTHITSTTNPHVTTKEQVGLGNVDNTSDLDKPISTATQTALDTKASTTALTEHTNNNDIHVTAAEKTKLNSIEAVGAIYKSTSNTNPSTIFDGTWTLVHSGYERQQIGTQVLYEGISGSGNVGKTNLIGAYNYELIIGLFLINASDVLSVSFQSD